MLNKEKLLNSLEGNGNIAKRTSLKHLLKLEKNNPELVPIQKELVPLHFTSNIYYSLYSPTMCAYFAHKSGCSAVAVNDYANLLAYKELKKACNLLSLLYACGYHVEIKPLFKEKKAVMYGYGAGVNDYKKITKALSEVCLMKKEEVLKKIKQINEEIKNYGISINEKAVLKNKLHVTTEKDIAKNLAEILVDKFGKNEELLDFLKNALKIDSCENDLRFIKEQGNVYFIEDLAKVIYTKYAILNYKGKKPDCKRFIELNSSFGVISSYKISVKSYDEKELSNIAETLISYGFNAVTFKCSELANLETQKIIDFFINKGLLPISLYRMGLPRQHLPSGEVSNQAYLNSLAVVGNAISVNCDKDDGLFGANTVKLCSDLRKRIDVFANIVKGKR